MRYTIITVTLNNREGLQRTIESVLNQTSTDFEYIVIDGGSTDGSVELIKSYQDRLAYWVSEPDKGVYNAMNKGVARATGEYLNFMNAGDSFYADTVLEAVGAYEGDFLAGDVFRLDSQQVQRYSKHPSFRTLCVYGFNHQAMFMKRVLFAEEAYDETLRILSDWKFVLKHVLQHNATYVPMELVVANFEAAGLSGNMMNLKRERTQVLSELLAPSILPDYEFLLLAKSPLLELLPELSETTRIDRYVTGLVRTILKIRRTLKSLMTYDS
ncbi:MAG: glycosyltransferase family 2 protein [Phocaeicola sp.]